jgi:K+-sensing histidine kinase KdpD
MLSFAACIEYIDVAISGPEFFRGWSGGMSGILKRWAAPVAASVALVALTTVLLTVVYEAWQPDHLIFAYFVPTAIIAVRYGSGPAILTAAASDLCAAYFFYPPDFSFYISDPLQVAELSFFSILALATCQFIGGLADDERLAKQAAPYDKSSRRLLPRSIRRTRSLDLS